MRNREPRVHILASQERSTLYIGVTSNLGGRIWQHRTGQTKGFVGKYHVLRLVHAEPCETMEEAIAREKQLKRWRRAWKINLIEDHNPEWRDLAVTWGLVETSQHGC